MTQSYPKIGPRATSFCDPGKWITADDGITSRKWHGYTFMLWQESDGRWTGSVTHGIFPFYSQRHGPFKTYLMLKLVLLDDMRRCLRIWRRPICLDRYVAA